MCKRAGQSVDRYLDRCRELSQETEQFFRDWTVHLAGEPTERHRKKFSYDKLQKAFEEEVLHLKDAVRKVVTARQEAANADGSNCRSADRGRTPNASTHPGGAAGAFAALEAVCEDQQSCPMSYGTGPVEEEDFGTGDGGVHAADVTLRQRIAAEREEGIRRIHGQVAEVNQMYRDLASIVSEQETQFQTIEQQAASAAVQQKQTVHELRKANDKQRGSRERLCWFLMIAVVLLCVVLVPHLRRSPVMSAIGHDAGSTRSDTPDTAAGALATLGSHSAAGSEHIPLRGFGLRQEGGAAATASSQSNSNSPSGGQTSTAMASLTMNSALRGSRAAAKGGGIPARDSSSHTALAAGTPSALPSSAATVVSNLGADQAVEDGVDVQVISETGQALT